MADSEVKVVERDAGVGGKTVVFVLLALIALGTALWFSFDFGRDILDKGTGGQFAASFEKECQPRHEVDLCKAVAGENHSRCLRDAASKGDSGVEYDQQAYLACMREALDSAANAP